MKKKYILIIVYIVTMIVSSLFSMIGMKHRKSENSEKEYKIITSSIYEAVKSEIAKPIYTAQAMANDVFMLEELKRESTYSEQEAVDKMTTYLQALKGATHAQTAFVVSEESKRYYTSDGLNKVIQPYTDGHDVWYTIFANTRKPYDLDVDVDQTNGNVWTVFANTRMEDENGTFLGVCGLGIAMDKLQLMLKEYETAYDIKVNFVDSDGLVQVDTDSVNIETAYLHDVQYGKEKDGYAYKNKENEYVIMRYVDELNWYLVIHGPERAVSVPDVLPIVVGAIGVSIINVGVVMWLDRKKTVAA